MNVVESYGFKDDYDSRSAGSSNSAHAFGGDSSGTDSDSEDQVARRANRFGGGLRSAKNALARLSVMEVEVDANGGILTSSPPRRLSGGIGGHPVKVDSKDTMLSSRPYGLSSGNPSPATPKRGLFQFRSSKSADATPSGSPLLRRAMMGNDLTGKSLPAHMRLKERSLGAASPLMARTMSVMSRAEQWLNEM
eukprot:gene1307-806_t